MELEKNELAALFPNVAAQMRGPLGNLYLAASQLISDEAREKDPQLDAKAAVLYQSFYQLLRMVTCLSMATNLTDDSPLPLRDVNIVDLVGEVCDCVGGPAGAMGLTLRFICAPEYHVCAVEPESLEKLLYHLLSNALKFTSAGGTITVELRMRDGRVFLSVKDTGCGIAEDVLPTLFDRYQHKQMLELPPHGLGLGLPLCQSIARRMGGTLMAESRVGVGSKFTLSLPDKQVGGSVSDVKVDYDGGFNPTLAGLADALPSKAFLKRYLD